MPEWGVEREAFACPEPVQGDREVMDTDLGHRFLQKGKYCDCNMQPVAITVRRSSGGLQVLSEARMDTAPRSGCPINAAVEVLGDPWAMLVLRDIMFGNRRHFRELIAGSEEGIATNILASRLKELVTAGLLTRDDARRGQRAAYSLTEAGIQVLPVMVALGDWGLAHRDGERRLQVRAELLRDGGPELVAAMIDELRELHLGVPRPNPDAPRASDQLRAAYEAEVLDKTTSEVAGS
jgi:DNA-binding HxlR family transcriptional regulator